MALSAPREAVAHLDRAFAASERRPARRLGVDLLSRPRPGQRNARRISSARTTTSPTALDAARARRDDRGRWEALHALGMLWAARDYARAGDYRREALDVSRALGDDSLVARSLNRVGNWHVNLEEPRRRAAAPRGSARDLRAARRRTRRRGNGGPDRDGASRRRRSARGGGELRARGRAVHGERTTVAGWPTRSACSRSAGRRITLVDHAIHEPAIGARSCASAVGAAGARDRLARGRGVLGFLIADCSGVARRVRSRDSDGARGVRPRRGDRASAVDGGRDAIARRHASSIFSRRTRRANSSRRRTRSRADSARACGSAGPRRRSPSRAARTSDIAGAAEILDGDARVTRPAGERCGAGDSASSSPHTWRAPTLAGARASSR